MQYCVHGSCYADHEGIHCRCPVQFKGDQCQGKTSISLNYREERRYSGTCTVHVLILQELFKIVR